MEFKNHEDQQAFELWAFGETGVRYGEPLLHTWNSRHGNKLWVIPSEKISDSMKKMYELYVNSTKGSTA
jgi:hypothetical protein